MVDESVEKLVNIIVNLFVFIIKNVFLSLDLVFLEVDIFEVFINFSIVYVWIKNSVGKVYVEKGDFDVL